MNLDVTETVKVSLLFIGFLLAAIFGALRDRIHKAYTTVIFGLLGSCIGYVVITTFEIELRLPNTTSRSLESAVNERLLTVANRDVLAYEVFHTFGLKRSTIILNDILKNSVSVDEADGYSLWETVVKRAQKSIKIINLMTKGWEDFRDSNAIQNQAINRGASIERINVYMNDSHKRDLMEVACNQSKHVPNIVLKEVGFEYLSMNNAFTRILDLQRQLGSISFLLVDDQYLVVYFLTERKDKRFGINGAMFTTDRKKTVFATEIFENISKHSSNLVNPCKD